jgi:PKHD-type hydroxylase
MSDATYLFKPKRNTAFPTMVLEPEFFTNDECDYIIDIGERTEIEKSTIAAGVKTDKRNSTNGWISPNYETNWIFKKLENKITEINNAHFQFDILGFYEKLQYTIYGPDKNHYMTHRDTGGGNLSIRKLSMVVMLTDPSTYEGGDLELYIEGEYQKVPNKKGNLIVFPSYEWHRVLPVNQGTRRTLVSWVSGPPFR